jgi:hypothetical protein
LLVNFRGIASRGTGRWPAKVKNAGWEGRQRKSQAMRTVGEKLFERWGAVPLSTNQRSRKAAGPLSNQFFVAVCLALVRATLLVFSCQPKEAA